MLEAVADPNNVAEALAWARGRLRAAGIEGAALDARVLLGAVLAIEGNALVGAERRPLTAAERERYCGLIEGRAARRPVSRLLGRRGFWDLELAIDDAVLDPRPETETLVEAVLARIADRAAALEILDLGTGSGCLLLALLGALPAARGLGLDCSTAALACARDNARRLGFAERARFVAGEWGGALAGRFDVIVANPPYIVDAEIDGLAPEVRRHDPRLALAGGPDGLDCHRALAGDLVRLLAPGGTAAVECGIDQAESVCEILQLAGAGSVERRSDLAGIARCLVVAG